MSWSLRGRGKQDHEEGQDWDSKGRRDRGEKRVKKEKLKLKQGGDRGEEVGGRGTIVAMEEILVMKETVSVVETVLVPLWAQGSVSR